MCGIAGIINLNNKSYSSQELSQKVKLMTNAVIHRGPDALGFYTGDEVFLGHSLLSIVDSTHRSGQPFACLGCVLVFNGEIYNFESIRAQLQTKGHRFETMSDTEVIIHAYKHWGFSCVDQFEGMWSFILFDQIKNLVFCSRDRFGQKPFYYSIFENLLLIASEVKQIKKISQKKEVNKDIVLDYLINNYVDHNNKTFYKGIEKLNPGHSLIIDLYEKNLNVSKYYEVSKSNEITNESFNDATERLDQLLTEAISTQIKTKVNLASMLSGGLDSSSINWYLSNLLPAERKTHSFFCKNSDIGQDESYFVKRVGSVTHIENTIIEPDFQYFKSKIEEVIRVQEYPSTTLSILMQYAVFEEMKKAKYKVSLDGQGADEIFLGYKKYIHFLNSWNSILKFTNKNNISNFEGLKLKYYFSSQNVRKLKNWNLRSCISKKNEPLRSDLLISEYSKNSKDPFYIQKFDIENGHLPQLLRYADKNSMTHSIENRNPFLNHNLVEFAINLPLSLKINNGWSKYLLRSVMKEKLPDEVVWRKNKIAFSYPLSFIENPLFKQDALKIIRESEVINQIFNKVPDLKSANELWRFYNLAAWENQTL